MNAAIFTTPNAPFELRDYPLTDPAPGMASVMLETSGLCGTDVHIWEGKLGMTGPMILGHEFLGRVCALGEGPRTDCLGQPLAPGDLVAVNVIEACGACRLCATGGAASCEHLGESLTYTRNPDEAPHFHGGFAAINYSPARYLHKLPAGLPADVAAALLCAGPTVIRGVAYAGLDASEHVVVQGSGPVGLFAVWYARLRGAATVTLLGSGSYPLRLELARALGADTVLDIRATTPDARRAAVLDRTDGRGADLVIEAAGAPDAIPEGLSLLRLRGRYVWTGQYSDRGTVAFPTHVVTFNALQLFGSAQFTVDDRAAYFALLAAHPEVWNDMRRIITHRVPLSQINDAFARAQAGQAVKTIIVPDM
jgi:threonine dehydrogenase-like Zn-dependent dehydrogenase